MVVGTTGNIMIALTPLVSVVLIFIATYFIQRMESQPGWSWRSLLRRR